MDLQSIDTESLTLAALLSKPVEEDREGDLPDVLSPHLQRPLSERLLSCLSPL